MTLLVGLIPQSQKYVWIHQLTINASKKHPQELAIAHSQQFQSFCCFHLLLSKSVASRIGLYIAADERVILFSAISSSNNLRLGIRLGLGLELGSVSVLIAGLTSTFRTPATCSSQWQNNITRSSAGLPLLSCIKVAGSLYLIT